MLGRIISMSLMTSWQPAYRTIESILIIRIMKMTVAIILTMIIIKKINILEVGTSYGYRINNNNINNYNHKKN